VNAALTQLVKDTTTHKTMAAQTPDGEASTQPLANPASLGRRRLKIFQNITLTKSSGSTKKKIGVSGGGMKRTFLK
jgi:hypothetical protein